MKKVLKSGMNKGNRRIWIEGNVLSDNGFKCGVRFNRVVGENTVTLHFTNGGKFKIAGKPDRPIIDMCGKWVSDFMGDATHFEVTINESIIIERIK